MKMKIKAEKLNPFNDQTNKRRNKVCRNLRPPVLATQRRISKPQKKVIILYLAKCKCIQSLFAREFGNMITNLQSIWIFNSKQTNTHTHTHTQQMIQHE